MSEPSIPPSYFRRYTFADGSVEVLGKFAAWVPGEHPEDPNRLYTFGAEEISVGEVELRPPSTYDESSEWADLRAFSVYDTPTIVFYLDAWGREARVGVEACLLIFELHELTHLLVPEEDDEHGPDHWVPWNRTLTEVAEWVMGIDSWDESDLSPGTPDETVEGTTAQATLSEIDG